LATKILWGMLAAWLGAVNVVSAASLKAYRFEGEDYVSAADVAGFYGLGNDRSTAKERAVYRGAMGSLVLDAERRDIELNGIVHWLSVPVLSHRDRLYVAATDVLKTLDPVLRQGRQRNPSAVRTIVLDPGHGGTDMGAHGERGIEKVLTLDLARRLRTVLEGQGFKVTLTRTTDRPLALEERVDFAERQRADLFVSIHLNSGGSASGIETFCLTPAGESSTGGSSRRDRDTSSGNRYDFANVWLAHCVQRSLIGSTGASDRGVRRARFLVLRDISCPAILVEGGFLSNETEEKKLVNAEYRDRLAKAMAAGIVNYRAGVERK